MEHEWLSAIGSAASAVAGFVVAVIAFVQLRDIKTQIKIAAAQNQQNADIAAWEHTGGLPKI